VTLEPKLNENPKMTILLGSTHQIWLAGMGALAITEREGSKFFEALVEEGEKQEAILKKSAREKIENIKDKATDQWNKLEEVFQKRVFRALKRLGVPSNKDIQLLYKRIEELRESIDQLAKLKGLAVPDEKSTPSSPPLDEQHA
jgi:poly(hydroxyalkanoate) granule-associated protein